MPRLVQEPRPTKVTEMKIGTWKLGLNRNVEEHVDMILNYFESGLLDILCLQDLNQYGHLLHRLSGQRGHALIPTTDYEGMLIRNGRDWHYHHDFVEVEGCHFVNVQAPTESLTGDKHPPKHRQYRRWMRDQLEYVKARHNLPLIMMGNWGVSTQDHGRFTPCWLATKARMKVIEPHSQDVQDYSLAKNVVLADRVKVYPWPLMENHPEHHLVTMRIIYRVALL